MSLTRGGTAGKGLADSIRFHANVLKKYRIVMDLNNDERFSQRFQKNC